MAVCNRKFIGSWLHVAPPKPTSIVRKKARPQGLELNVTSSQNPKKITDPVRSSLFKLRVSKKCLNVKESPVRLSILVKLGQEVAHLHHLSVQLMCLCISPLKESKINLRSDTDSEDSRQSQDSIIIVL